MNILLNGKQRDVVARDLLTALEELGLGGAKVATALNGAFVPVAARKDTKLRDGDWLEVVAPKQGG